MHSNAYKFQNLPDLFKKTHRAKHLGLIARHVPEFIFCARYGTKMPDSVTLPALNLVIFSLQSAYFMDTDDFIVEIATFAPSPFASLLFAFPYSIVFSHSRSLTCIVLVMLLYNIYHMYNMYVITRRENETRTTRLGACRMIV